MSEEAIKAKCIVRLHEGDEPKVIASELEIPYSRVLRYRGELNTAIADGNLNKLLNMDEAAVALMSDELVRSLPAELQPQAEENLAAIGSGIKGLDRLSGELQLTATHLNSRIRTLSMSIEHVSELTELTKSLCELQNAFFNKQGVNVNIQNNSPGGSTYTEILSDKPGGV